MNVSTHVVRCGRADVPLEIPFRASVLAGPTLQQLLADLNKLSASPAVLYKLDDLRFVPTVQVKKLLGETVQAISAIMQHAKTGTGRNIPSYLFKIGKAADAHRPLLVCLKRSPYNQQVEALFEGACQQKGIFENPGAVAQTAMAQVSLRTYYPHFWHKLPQECISCWNGKTARSVVYSYGKLYESGIAPSPDRRLRELQIDTVLLHSQDLDAQGVSNCAWSLAKQGIALRDSLVRVRDASGCVPTDCPFMKAVMRVADQMNAQGVANTLGAFADSQLQLGPALEPMTKAVMRVADQMNAQHVAMTLRAFAELQLELGPAHEPMMKAVIRVADEMNAQEVANTLRAFAELQLELGPAHEPMMKAVIRVADQMNAQDVAMTLRAFAELQLELGPAHEPMMKAVIRVADEMNAQECCNDTTGICQHGAGARAST